uniref:Kelch-like protein 32 n=1 Tax=Petromyzon marinus TaxID=7757 RepID=A0AAJ7XFU1_PETMA|nr:kelch-like protein 32 [Petromyzon marinus]
MSSLLSDRGRRCSARGHTRSVLAALDAQRHAASTASASTATAASAAAFSASLCDVRLRAGARSFPAHRAVLAACSDYFRAMFSISMLESGAEEISLKGISALGLQHVLDFAYTGQIVLDPKNIQDVLSAANHLQFLEILQLCSNYLAQEVTLENLEFMHWLADTYSLPGLQTALARFVERNLRSLLRSRPLHVMALPLSLLGAVLRSDSLTNFSELDLFLLTLRWLSHDPTSRLPRASEALSCVRLALLDPVVLRAMVLPRAIAMDDANGNGPADAGETGAGGTGAATNNNAAVAARNGARNTEGATGENRGGGATRFPVSSSPSSSSSCRLLVEEALAYHAHEHAQPVRQTAQSRLRHRGMVLHVVGGKKRDASKASEIRYLIRTRTRPVGDGFGRQGSSDADGGGDDEDDDDDERADDDDEEEGGGGGSRGVDVGLGRVRETRGGGGRGGGATGFGGAAVPGGAWEWRDRGCLISGRSHHSVAVLGGFLFVAGGEVDHRAVRDVYRYDPRSNTWIMVSSMRNCREHFVLGALGGQLMSAGGRNELRQVLPTVERYSPEADTWSFVRPFDRSLSCHAGCVADGRLWVSGGVTNTAQYQNSLLVYDPALDVWAACSAMPQRRVYHSMAAVCRRLYVLGGNDLDHNNDRVMVRHIDRYCLDTDQWTRCTAALSTGQNEAGVAVHAGKIYLVGGYSILINEPLASVQILDVFAGRAEQGELGGERLLTGPALPFASNGVSACFLPRPIACKPHSLW